MKRIMILDRGTLVCKREGCWYGYGGYGEPYRARYDLCRLVGCSVEDCICTLVPNARVMKSRCENKVEKKNTIVTM